ncbi:hypothetical protein LSPCS325_11430 [Lysinibacillus sp. CTST325]
MNELQYEHQLNLLGQLRERLRRLEDVDYMTAYYKGYSLSGETLEEIKEEINNLNVEISELENQVDDISW